jgi:hypothetical protein
VCYNKSTDYEGVNAMEQWKAVVGYEGLYEASNLGNIRSIDRVAISNNGRTRALKGKVLVQVTTPDGYKRTQLNKDGKGKMYFSHRIVAEAFIENNDNLPQVNHIDGDKSNNIVTNLEWISRSDNQHHAYGTGLQQVGEKHARAKLTTEQVHYIRKNYVKSSHEFSTTALARKFGVTSGCIWFIIKGLNRKYETEGSK